MKDPFLLIYIYKHWTANIQENTNIQSHISKLSALKMEKSALTNLPTNGFTITSKDKVNIYIF